MELISFNTIFEENFILDPLLTYNGFDNDDYYDPAEIFKSESLDIDSIFAEAVTKNNLLQRLWEIIKKAANWIISKIMQLVKGIKRAIFGKKKTANQILKQIKADSPVLDFSTGGGLGNKTSLSRHAHMNNSDCGFAFAVFHPGTSVPLGNPWKN